MHKKCREWHASSGIARGTHQDWRLGIAIHEIKAAANLGGADRVIIYDDGTVTGARDGEYLGNVHDED